MVTKHPSARKKARARKVNPGPEAERTLWDNLAEIGDSVPARVWAKLPADLAKNFDHYAHGSPRQD